MVLYSPWFHPRYYGEKITDNANLMLSSQASGYLKDRCFRSERMFLTQTHGVEPWQMGPLTENLQFQSNGVFIPGGHIQGPSQHGIQHVIPDDQFIKPDENSWFSFFKKDRWYGGAVGDGAIKGKLWSVDDPEVWTQFSFVLELSNRILNALIKDRHTFMETLLYGRLGYWKDPPIGYFPPTLEPSPNARVLLSIPFMRNFWLQYQPQLPFPMEMYSQMTEADWRARLDHLNVGQRWALVDFEGDQAKGLAGITATDTNRMICLGVEHLKTLTAGKCTLAERCNAIFFMAVTLLHEFSHAVMYSRTIKDSPVDPCHTIHVLDVNYQEPFIDYQGCSELGYAFESQVLGGVARSLIHRGPDPVVLAAIKESWPYPDLTPSSTALGEMALGHPDFAPGVEMIATMIPSIWVSSILSNNFWDDQRFLRKSDSFFYTFDNIRGKTLNGPNQGYWIPRNPPMLEGYKDLFLAASQGTLNRGLAILIREWDQRAQVLVTARQNWYYQERSMWLRTPWGHIERRQSVTKFTRQIKKPLADRDEYLIIYHMNYLLGTMPWSMTRRNYITRLDSPGPEWVYHLIGLLMAATIPLRAIKKTKHVPPPAKKYILTPSTHVANQATDEFNMVEFVSWSPTEAEETYFSDPLVNVADLDNPQLPNQVPYGSFGHIEYLKLIEEIYKFWSIRGTHVSAPWFDEIGRVAKKLLERREMERDRGDDVWTRADSWADDLWDFKIPEYDGSTISWDMQQNAWIRSPQGSNQQQQQQQLPVVPNAPPIVAAPITGQAPLNPAPMAPVPMMGQAPLNPAPIVTNPTMGQIPMNNPAPVAPMMIGGQAPLNPPFNFNAPNLAIGGQVPPLNAPPMMMGQQPPMNMNPVPNAPNLSMGQGQPPMNPAFIPFMTGQAPPWHAPQPPMGPGPGPGQGQGQGQGQGPGP